MTNKYKIKDEAKIVKELEQRKKEVKASIKKDLKNSEGVIYISYNEGDVLKTMHIADLDMLARLMVENGIFLEGLTNKMALLQKVSTKKIRM